MRRIVVFIFCVFILSSSSFLKVFSQESDKLFKTHLELGYSAKITKTGNKMRGPQLFVTPTYTIGNNANVGMGAGIKLFKEGNNETVKAFPVYLAGMYRFSDEKVVPFVEGKLGYAFINKNYSAKLSNYYPEYPGTVEFKTKKKGGIFFSPSVGVLFPVKNRQKIAVSAAYILEQDSYTSRAVQVDKIETGRNTHHSVALRIGYIF